MAEDSHKLERLVELYFKLDSAVVLFYVPTRRVRYKSLHDNKCVLIVQIPLTLSLSLSLSLRPSQLSLLVGTLPGIQYLHSVDACKGFVRQATRICPSV